MGVAIGSYFFTVQRAKEEAKEKATMVLSFLDATRKYMKEVQKPIVTKIVGKDRFYPDLMSGFVASRNIFERFSKVLPAYKFKQATIDPLNPKNKADEKEIELIREFKKNPNLSIKEGNITKNGVRYFYIARPIRVESKKCLRCHGDPKDAPEDQVRMYGDKNGYHWEEGDTVASYIVYIPMQKALAKAKSASVSLAGIGGALVLVTIAVIWFFLNKGVVGPLMFLSAKAEEISMGKDLEKNLGEVAQKKDEIGALAKAIDRLRLSILKIMKMKG